jgi:hypothetical protein
MMFCRIVQSGRAVRGVVKLPLASELYDADRNWGRTRRLPTTGALDSKLNPSVAAWQSSEGVEDASRL